MKGSTKFWISLAIVGLGWLNWKLWPYVICDPPNVLAFMFFILEGSAIFVTLGTIWTEWEIRSQDNEYQGFHAISIGASIRYINRVLDRIFE